MIAHQIDGSTLSVKNSATPTLSELAGRISSPQPGERVSNTFTARGTLTSAPS
ncbi:MAG: hypothetical protein QOF69_3400, partial [Solirubrobacteraceae bacterium]|nr:hypothetical protein [Solirubrobacteraceae bacterium]